MLIILTCAAPLVAQSRRVNPAATPTAAVALELSVKQMFDEANAYTKTKFAEFEQKKIGYSERLRLQTEREQKQLAAKYAFLIDACTNGGNDFADLFTPDGEFSVSQAWGATGAKPIKGRAALVNAAGGDGKGNCRDPKTLMGFGISHISVNHVITPTPQGAIGKSYLLAIGVGGEQAGDVVGDRFLRQIRP